MRRNGSQFEIINGMRERIPKQMAPSASKLSDQISVRFPPEIRSALSEIEERHGIPPTVFIRRMVEAGVTLYHAQGSFSFPVKVAADSPSPPSQSS
ncbi:hypothetical protein OpiT1DRAFT_03632 [Opitutaceae bacterium TAV1]|nr:hypothetical protein OpiT1DRAFT_03632 [Opitutaceae bacterium TAV1]